jgi:hypothetical protein
MSESTPAPLTECSSDFPTAPADKYRYFNQPLEQIPGFVDGEVQVLFNHKGALVWQTIPKCVEVLKCVKLEAVDGGQSLTMQQQIIRPLQDLGELTGEGGSASACQKIPTEAIDVVTCISLEGNELKITRKRVYVLKQDDATGGCDNIPVTECTTSSPTP